MNELSKVAQPMNLQELADTLKECGFNTSQRYRLYEAGYGAPAPAEDIRHGIAVNPLSESQFSYSGVVLKAAEDSDRMRALLCTAIEMSPRNVRLAQLTTRFLNRGIEAPKGLADISSFDEITPPAPGRRAG